MLPLKLSCIFLILLSTLLAAIYPFTRKLKKHSYYDFPVGEALASGIFLGAGLVHMLGEASRHFNTSGYHYPFAFLLAGIIFMILLFFEHIGKEMHEHNNEKSPEFAHLTVFMLSLHSFLEGAALGLSDSLSMMLVILSAVMAHKWAASFAVAVQINKSTLSMKSGALLFLIFAIMTPLGILFGTTAMDHMREYPLLEPIFVSLAAGTFLYLGTLHGLQRAVMIEKCCNLKHFGFVVLGFSVMAVVAIWT